MLDLASTEVMGASKVLEEKLCKSFLDRVPKEKPRVSVKMRCGFLLIVTYMTIPSKDFILPLELKLYSIGKSQP